MTINQEMNFYKQDEKKYNVSQNQELLMWLKEAIEKGYHPAVDSVKEIQELIDSIARWYEIKYPEREMELEDGIENTDFKNIESLSKMMDINQLMYRLPHSQLCLIRCNYHSNAGCCITHYDIEGNLKEKKVLYMRINENLDNDLSTSEKNNFAIIADVTNGQVYGLDDKLESYTNRENITTLYITLDKLLDLFKENYADKLNFTALEECVYDHNCNIELRRRVLQLVALKLLYSNNTCPEIGYERAKRFINEFNNEMDLNLSSNEIDKLINKDYSNTNNYVSASNQASTKPRKGKNLIKSLLKK